MEVRFLYLTEMQSTYVFDKMIKCIIKPVFTKEQVKDCEKCPHISGKKIWCCKFGVYIHETEKKVKTKKVIIIKGKARKYPSIIKQAGSFGKAAVQQTLAGNPRRTQQEIAFCKEQCWKCDEFNKEKLRCFLCGCHMGRKWPWKTTHCKIDKW